MNRSQLEGWKRLLGTFVLRAGGFALLILASGARSVQAFPMYDDSGKGCVQCHSFKGDNSTNPLHAAHWNSFGITKCTLCHMYDWGGAPVYTYKSGTVSHTSSGEAVSGYGCAGCHGNDYGEYSLEGKLKATGYGLRKAHAARGETVCGNCHYPGSTTTGDPRPAPEVKPETSKPPYYGMLCDGVPCSKLTDPCDSTQENFTNPLAEKLPTPWGLDNDGNGLADFPLDPNCAQLLLSDPNRALTLLLHLLRQ